MSEKLKINLILELRKYGITDKAVLATIEKIPREDFIDKELFFKAYKNDALPISCNQTISQPAVVAKMTELLEPDKSCKVLEIGTGSGYQTAILSNLFKRVYTIERFKDLHENSKEILKNLNLKNIVFYHGDGQKGWPAKFFFNRIILTAVTNKIPENLLKQLADDGIFVLPLIHKSSQYITTIKKKNNSIKIKRYWKVRFVPMESGIQ